MARSNTPGNRPTPLTKTAKDLKYNAFASLGTVSVSQLSQAHLLYQSV
jgi:hypothetical protein